MALPNSPLLQSLQEQERYVVTQVGTHQLAFLSHWVAEILLIERLQILSLPFYEPSLLGVVHNHGQIVPLVSGQVFLQATQRSTREAISVVQLSQALGHLAGVGIVVDQALESRSRDQLPEWLFDSNSSKSSSQPHALLQLFRPELLSDRLWHPMRWAS
ncbi:MAG: hypothetical protein Kow00121_46190 [Elainellaceae cyanobacterium]